MVPVRGVDHLYCTNVLGGVHGMRPVLVEAQHLATGFSGRAFFTAKAQSTPRNSKAFEPQRHKGHEEGQNQFNRNPV
jgi:hypothetical protein